MVLDLRERGCCDGLTHAVHVLVGDVEFECEFRKFNREHVFGAFDDDFASAAGGDAAKDRNAIDIVVTGRPQAS